MTYEDRGRGCHVITDAEIDVLARRVSNWGRWGRDDQLGALNFVTSRKRLEASACVRTGMVYSLALEVRQDLPQAPGSSRSNPLHLMTMTGADAAALGDITGWADDVLIMPVHAATHWDALAHVFHHDRMYNNRHCAAVTSSGAQVNDILPVAGNMVTRGVLVDVARQRGQEALEPDEEIRISDLEAALEEQRVEVTAGDALLIRTGHLGRARATRNWKSYTDVGGLMPAEPGIGTACVTWLHEHGVAAVACDNWAVEWIPGREAERLPVHELALVYMGMLLGENFDLDELAEACAADGHYDFLLAAAPLPIRGGIGGPVNPVAIK